MANHNNMLAKPKKVEAPAKPSCLVKREAAKRGFFVFALSLMLAFSTLLLGCGSQNEGSSFEDGVAPLESSGTAQESLSEQLVIGSLATEDILPMWVAEAEGIFAEQGIDARVETFQSAQELSTAIVAGAVDVAMTDIMVSATLTASGTPVTMEWVTLGSTVEQGRFGIMTSPESGITSLEELADVPVAVGSCTVPEYVMDTLLKEAGLESSQIVSEEIKKVPVRYEMMSANQVAAAALPGSLLALGEASGMILLADDTAGENLSQSVMVVREDAGIRLDGGSVEIEKLAASWDEAAERINTNPENYRELLVEKAQLPDPVKDSYPISTYPKTMRPSSAMVDPVLDWMFEKGYLAEALSYDHTTGSFNP